ncbi:unnamed protein product, partial [Rotaria sp. Silwood1]
MIRRVVDECRFNHNSYLEKFGLTVDVNEMLMLPARVTSKYGIRFNSPSIEKSDAAVPQTILAC